MADAQQHTESAVGGGLGEKSVRAAGVVPPDIHGSVAQLGDKAREGLTPDFVTIFEGKVVPFWRPGAPDVVRAIGWWWLMLIPCAIVVLGVPVVMVMAPAITAHAVGHEIKLWLLALGGGITIVLSAIKRGVAARKDRFCIHCGYTLAGLEAEGRCPECGRGYVFSLVDEFRKDPHFFEERYRKLRSHPPAEVFAAGLGPTPDDGTR